MSRPKIARKSTSVDMTAMCDVAFLLLSFFILTAKPKTSENIEIATPSSVASKIAPEKDVTLISITKDGKVYLSMDNADVKGEVANQLNANNGANLSPADIAAFKKAEFFGTPISQLKSALQIPSDKLKAASLPGIPILDTSHNELTAWMRAIVAASASSNKKLNILLKGDNDSKYPAFKGVKTALLKNDQPKFQMITNAEGIPEGTDLWKRLKSGQSLSE
jgi:biopolymer transport protein ExbD